MSGLLDHLISLPLAQAPEAVTQHVQQAVQHAAQGFNFMDWAFPSGKMEKFQNNPPSWWEVIFAMCYSLALNLCIAQVYRKTYRGTRYSQDYVQTLIMIGVVTTILIMVVSGNGYIAFGMFAAFSVIRFRRNLGHCATWHSSSSPWPSAWWWEPGCGGRRCSSWRSSAPPSWC